MTNLEAYTHAAAVRDHLQATGMMKPSYTAMLSAIVNQLKKAAEADGARLAKQ